MRWTEIREEWLARPGFREAFEREYPYRDSRSRSASLRARIST